MKEFFGAITIVLSLIGYIPYIRDVLKGKTQPHAFTWTIWTLVTFIVGAAQIAAGSGWGAIHNLVTGLIGTVILIYALKNKDKDIKRVDVIMFIIALLSIPLWLVTQNPTTAIVLITAIDIFAFLPTFRKTWNKPYSETLISYELAGIKYCFALLAIGTYDFATLLYPVTLVVMNASLVAIIIIRRKKLPNHAGSSQTTIVVD